VSGFSRRLLREFYRDDPAVMAAGGLIHTLLSHCAWMDDGESNVFVVDEWYAVGSPLPFVVRVLREGQKTIQAIFSMTVFFRIFLNDPNDTNVPVS